MSEIASYIEAVKQRFHLTSDYALARKLGITQPEANLIRRGLKIPKPELCITIAKLLDKNPVELLLLAQKDKAPAQAKDYWTLALTAVDVMLHLPERPRYLSRKVEAIGKELRQIESQALVYEGAAASAEAVRMMEAVQQSVDAVMERWNIWKRGEALYPNYLLANQAAVRRRVTIRRLLILTREQMRDAAWRNDAVQVMDDQHRAGIGIFYAFKEAVAHAAAFERFAEDYKKSGAAEEINAAMFDREVLMFSRSYGQVPLGVVGKPTPITMINQMQITWNPDLIRVLDPAPLFDMTRYVLEYGDESGFREQVDRFLHEEGTRP
ncbi:MAG: helix-turn-helix transcriptional regulator [Nitrospirae bacterium]|nr:helix-turn-helix transcriptional regulator [Nitrospirota bacterium]